MNRLFGVFKTWRGLPAQLFLLVILPFAILALAATLMSIGLHQNAMRSMIAERDMQTVDTAANFLESKIQSEQDITDVLAMQNEESLTLQAFVTEHNYTMKNLALISEDGNILNYSGMDEIETALGSLTIQPSEIQIIKVSQTIYLVFSARSSNGTLAVNVVQVEPLLRMVVGENFIRRAESAAFLIDGGGDVLARIGNQGWEGVPAQHPGVAEALQGHSGFTYMATSTMEHVIAYSPVSPPGWAMVIEEPWESVDTPYLRLTQFAPLLLIP
jgi:ethanolamine utilization microcompartment shell protein EutS